jgi:hypothetical protein
MSLLTTPLALLVRHSLGLPHGRHQHGPWLLVVDLQVGLVLSQAMHQLFTLIQHQAG